MFQYECSSFLILFHLPRIIFYIFFFASFFFNSLLCYLLNLSFILNLLPYFSDSSSYSFIDHHHQLWINPEKPQLAAQDCLEKETNLPMNCLNNKSRSVLEYFHVSWNAWSYYQHSPLLFCLFSSSLIVRVKFLKS